MNDAERYIENEEQQKKSRRNLKLQPDICLKNLRNAETKKTIRLAGVTAKTGTGPSHKYYRLDQRFPTFLTRGALFRINFYGGAPCPPYVLQVNGV